MRSRRAWLTASLKPSALPSGLRCLHPRMWATYRRHMNRKLAAPGLAGIFTPGTGGCASRFASTHRPQMVSTCPGEAPAAFAQSAMSALSVGERSVIMLAFWKVVSASSNRNGCEVNAAMGGTGERRRKDSSWSELVMRASSSSRGWSRRVDSTRKSGALPLDVD